MASPHRHLLNYSLPQLRATRRTNLALLTVAILERCSLAISVLVRAWRVELPYSHHQRKKRLFRFLSNTGFDTVAVQTALLGPIRQATKLRGLTPSCSPITITLNCNPAGFPIHHLRRPQSWPLPVWALP